MHTQARLCHIDDQRCVVEVSLLGAQGVIASALGEAASAEEAEDRALQRLSQRQGDPEPAATRTIQPLLRRPAAETAVRLSTESVPLTAPLLEPPPTPAAPLKPRAASEPNPGREAGRPSPPSEAPTDPEDWSEELTAIDLELQRLGWERDQERLYLERAFGHGSRHRLTRYSDLLAFLKRLRTLEPGISADAAPIPLRRSDLIQQGDQMLQTLGWSPSQGRDFLQQHLQTTSRQQLTDDQLLQFNMLLEEQLIGLSSSSASATGAAEAG